MVSVPGEVCDLFSDFEHTYEGTAAVIVGGFAGDFITPNAVLNSTEIFGCPEEEAVPALPDFPMSVRKRVSPRQAA